MSFLKLQFRPGVNRDQTSYSSEGGWYECDKIRFRSGFPEKIGGWTKATPTAFLGVCRQMWNWVTSFSDNFLAMGTNKKVYIEVSGYFYDITPLRTDDPTITTTATDNCVATSNGSRVVTINLAPPTVHEADTGSFVTISGVSGAVGGIPDSEINANHEITVIDADSFSFEVATAATSTVTAGGGTAIVIDFEVTPGYATATLGYGWGTGPWGSGAWGLGSPTPIVFPQRDWWFDNFDNDLVMNIRNGAIYWWERGATADPATALATRAIRMEDYAVAEGFTAADVPAAAMQVLVSQNDKHLIAFGCVPFGSSDPADFDPLLIRWADQDTPGQWEPQVTNTAGFLRISRGSRIVRALPTRQEILVWTDTHLFTLQFLGTTDVFGLQEYADNISIISSRACASAASITYWMGQDKFYAYTGRVETLPCTLRNHVFQNINHDQTDQIICGTNEAWNEVWWFYPSANSNWNDSYVVYNHLEKLWYYGSLARTAWLDTPLRPYPQASDSDTLAVDGYLYNHEDGLDADGEAMEAYIQSSDFDLGDGEQFMLSRRVIPDISFSGSTADEPEVTFEVRPRSFPGSSFGADPADQQRVIQTSVGQYTAQVFVRARARQMAMKVFSENLGVQWQLGAPRIDVRQDGRR
jgi:hypothetical protein